jgi:HAD superfamily hydrolase (TIGR01450 family)
MPLASSDQPLCDVYDLAMLDLDGVVYRGDEAVAGAIVAIEQARGAGMRMAYLTNNASRPPTAVAERLRGFGVPASDDEVVTAGEAIAHVVAESVPRGSAVLVVGGPGLREPLERLGLRVVDKADASPAAVVQGFHPDVDWRALAEASYAIQAGVPWFASNADQTIPTGRGVAPGNGSLIEAVRRATGATPVVAGKPERGLFEETIERTEATRPLMVGDRLDTDIDGALNFGVDALLVLTGVSTLTEVLALPAHRRPHYVSASLAGLVRPHPAVSIEAESARCGGVTVALQNDDIVTMSEESADDVALLRAVVALGWETADATGRVPRWDGPALGH